VNASEAQVEQAMAKVSQEGVALEYDYLILATGASHSDFGRDDSPGLLLGSRA